jgi:hypothetical protein
MDWPTVVLTAIGTLFVLRLISIGVTALFLGQGHAVL